MYFSFVVDGDVNAPITAYDIFCFRNNTSLCAISAFQQSKLGLFFDCSHRSSSNVLLTLGER